MTYTIGSPTIFNSAPIIRDSDGAHIPSDPGNLDYQAYLAWVAQGNTATSYIPPAPPTQTVIASEDFINRFNPTEEQAIMTAAQSSWQVNLWITKMTAAPSVDVTNPITINGMAALVVAGLITSARSTQVLNLTLSSP